MHILLLTPNFHPEVNASATRQYEHCRRWAAAGHDVTVVTGVPNWPMGRVFDGYRNQWKSEEMIDGIRVLRVWTLISPNQGFLLRILSFISYMVRATWAACCTRKVDVVVATSPHFFSGLAGMLTRYVTGRRFVLEIRDIWPESIVAVGAMKRSAVIRALEWLERRMYASADHIVTVGNGYRQQLMDRGVSPSVISVVPNGIDTTRNQVLETREIVRQRYGAGDRHVCAYVGTIGMAHGLNVVLKAAEHLRSQNRDDVVFWLVGDGAERENLEKVARDRGLSNVVFTGLVSKRLVSGVVAAADSCLVHLRGTELFGTVIPSKIFEIMYAEKPIVMGVRGEAQRMVTQNQAGVAMRPDDAGSLLSAVQTIASSPETYSRGRDFVTEQFNRDTLAGQMLTILCEEGATTNRMPIPEQDDADSDLAHAA